MTESSLPSPARAAALAAACRIAPEKRYLLHNRTPAEIRVHDELQGELTLPPLTKRVMQGELLAPFADQLQQLKQRHQLGVREYAGASRSLPLVLLVWAAVLGLLLVVVYNTLVHGTLVRPLALAAMAWCVLVVVGVLVTSAVLEDRRRRREEVAEIEEGDIDLDVGGTYDGNDTARRTKNILVVLAVILIGGVLPTLAIFVGTDAKDFLIMRDGLRVADGLESRLVSRLIQVIYTAVLSLFPALLYFQFDRHRVGTIRDKWVRAIFDMDPQVKTLADVDARYGKELAEASSYSTDSARLLVGRNSPILIATILVSLGWTLLVVRTESFDFAGATKVAGVVAAADDAAARAHDAAAADAGLRARAAAAEAAADQARRSSEEAARIAAESVGDTVPSVPTPTTEPGTQPDGQSEAAIANDAATAAAAADDAVASSQAVRQPFFQLLVPDPSAATLGFLGAYFFGVYLILRSYFRGDLRPKLYNQISARLVTVVVLAYLLTVLWSDTNERNPFLWTLAFLAGVVPTTALRQIGGLATGAIGAVTAKNDSLQNAFKETFATPRSLTQIDGVDIYESSRLESEGITDIPSLAKSNLVTTMINTRLPIERLVDWTDQAVLILLLDRGDDEQLCKPVRCLRDLGIRTATDLLAVAHDEAATTTRPEVEAILTGTAPDAHRATDGAAHLSWLANRIEAQPSIRRIQRWQAAVVATLTDDIPLIEVGKPLVAATPTEPPLAKSHPAA